MLRRSTALIAGVGAGLIGTAATAAPLFSDNFDVDSKANWNVNQNSLDNEAIFGWDYSTAGVPAAPNSGGITKGLKFTSNNNVDGANTAATTGITVSPKGQSFTDTTTGYRVKFHMWINANGPFPAGGTGSTEFVTAGIGYNNSTVNFNGTTTTGSGGWFAVDGEGGSIGTGARDYRAFKNASEQFPASGQFAAGTASTDGDNTDTYYTTNFPGNAPPAAQAALHSNQTGTTAAGTVGFKWREVVIEVKGTQAIWSIDGVRLVTLDTAVGSTFPLSGNISLGYMDIFSSVSSNPAMSFGLIDNLSVEAIPEPASMGLLALSSMALGLRRRRA